MKLIFSLAIFSVLFSSQSLAQESVDYVAKANDSGKFCAKVEVYAAGRGYIMKRKCRTLSQWEAAGYKVSVPDEPVLETTEEQEKVVA